LPGFLASVRKDEDVGVAGIMKLIDDVRLGSTEAARKREELAGREALPLDRQHACFPQRPGELAELGIGKLAREIDALDRAAKHIRQPALRQHRQRALAHQRKYSGEISRGRMSGISGQAMIAASTNSIGTSMIIVSFSA